MSMSKIHEMRSKEQENIKNTKSIALKANKDESDLDDDSTYELGEEELNSLCTLGKSLKKETLKESLRVNHPSVLVVNNRVIFLLIVQRKRKNS